MKLSKAIAVALGGLVGGCTGVGSQETAGAEASRSLQIPLQASRANAGEIGTAILVPQGERTGVIVEISGVPMGTSRPVHLYTFIYAGECAKLSPTPVYALTERVLADSPAAAGRMTATIPPFRVSNFAPVPLATLQRSSHAIQVRTAPQDGNLAIFCGNVPGE